MKKWAFIFIFLTVCSPVFAQDFLAKKQVRLGEAVPDFTLQDLQGRSVSLAGLRGKIVMLHFWSAKCPFVLRYTERLHAVYKDYSDKVAIFGIDSNASETPEEMKSVKAERKDPYPILLDPGNKVADEFGAITTPHVFILDREGRLVYEGAVDDQGWSKDKKPKLAYVREALDALLADKPVPHPQTKTAGCTVKRSQ